MIKLKNMLNENPDNVYKKHTTLSWSHYDAICFGYSDDGIMRVGNDVHREMWAKYEDDKQDPLYQDDTDRNRLTYCGRLWWERKVIAFWDYPLKNEMSQTLRDIEAAYQRVNKEGIWENPSNADDFPRSLNFMNKKWKIEVLLEGNDYVYDPDDDDMENKDYTLKLIPLSDYSGSKKRSAEDLAAQHVMSPLLKQKKEPHGWGSTKDTTKTLNPHLNPKLKYGDDRAYWGDNTIKMGDLLEKNLTKAQLKAKAEKKYGKMLFGHMIKLKNILTEIGEATMPPFPYKLTDNSSDYKEYTINITKDIKIELIFTLGYIDIDDENLILKLPIVKNMLKWTKKIKICDITFDVDADTYHYISKNVPNANDDTGLMEGFLSAKQALQLMSTIVKIIKEFIDKKMKSKYFIFDFVPVKKNKLDVRRENLYLAFLKKNLPNNYIFYIENLINQTIIYFRPKLPND